ncbi:MAG: MFS transporter [Solirubrobacteraceae bacterium]
MSQTLSDQRIRRITLAFIGFATAEYGVWVTVLVFAYQRGGATTAAGVAVAQLVPASLLAPILARSADRHSPARALRRGYWCQSLSLAATALALVASMPETLVYLGAVIAASAVTTTRPAQAALVPTLVDTGQRLTAFSVVASWVDSVSLLAGPAIAGLMIGLGGTAAALASFAVALTASALLVAGVSAQEHARPAVGAERIGAAPPTGVRDAMREDPGLAALLAVLVVEYLVIGMLDVLVVVLSLDVLSLGASGAGYLNGALGAGAVLGSFAALSLIGHRGLVAPLLASALAGALSVAVLGAWPTVAGAFLLLTTAGTARSLLDVCSRTLMLRAAPAAVRGRLFGVVEGSTTIGLAIGSMLVPLLFAVGGLQVVLLAAGALLAAVGLAAAPTLRGSEQAASSAIGRRGAQQVQSERRATGLISTPLGSTRD